MSSIGNEDKLIFHMHGRLHYGADQAWYKSPLQRFSGCGPTVCANIIYYLWASGELPELKIPKGDTHHIIGLMDDMWSYVTPGNMGINSTRMLSAGLEKFAEAKGLKLDIHALDINESRKIRPGFKEVSKFIDESFDKGCPIAFLNLSNGSLRNLENWHWVMMTGLDHYKATILDQGQKKVIDLNEWLRSTLLGGGFVSVGTGI